MDIVYLHRVDIATVPLDLHQLGRSESISLSLDGFGCSTAHSPDMDGDAQRLLVRGERDKFDFNSV